MIVIGREQGASSRYRKALRSSDRHVAASVEAQVAAIAAVALGQHYTVETKAVAVWRRLAVVADVLDDWLRISVGLVRPVDGSLA